MEIISRRAVITEESCRIFCKDKDREVKQSVKQRMEFCVEGERKKNKRIIKTSKTQSFT